MSDKFAMVFPGQGSQTPGMLSELAQQQPAITETFQEASDALGIDLWNITQENPDDLLNQTAYTQPALLAASTALWRVWLASGRDKPAVLAGHSLGEYSALVCADAVAFSDAIKIVHKRGQLMQEAVPMGQGAMGAVIGLTEDKVFEACELAAEGSVVQPANFNANGQIVISGETAAVDRALVKAKELGAKIAKKLPVSVPSHCLLMEPAAKLLAEELNKFEITMPTIPVIHNVDVSVSDSVEAIKDKLVKQLFSPVKWVETIEFINQQGIENLYECGPGTVLAGLNKRIIKTMTVTAMDAADAFA